MAEPRPDPFAQNLQGVTSEIAAIDELIAKHAPRWRIERMPAVDRNVLRIAVYEMLRTDTPAAIVIDEALELAPFRGRGIGSVRQRRPRRHPPRAPGEVTARR